MNDENIPEETLLMIDEAMKNLKKGNVSKPINLDDIEKDEKND